MNDLESRLRTAMNEQTSDVSAPPTLADDMVNRGSKVRRQRRLAGGAAGLVVLAALVPLWRIIDASSGATPPAKAPQETVLTQAPPPSPLTPNRPKLVWSADPVDVQHTTRGVTRVVDLRVARHGAYDRVVVDIEGPVLRLPGGIRPSLHPPGEHPEATARRGRAHAAAQRDHA